MASYDFAAQRLYVEAALTSGAQVEASGEQANYLLNVLRLKEGAALLLFNGRDGEWRARLSSAKKRAAVLSVEAQTRPQTYGPDIDLCFAPLKHARLDYMVQKAAEMGAGRLRPVMTRRTQAARVNLERMRANAIEAAEQCGVLHIAEVCADAPFGKVLQDWDDERLIIFCDEDAEIANPLAALEARRGAKKLAVFIGPEGGFDAEERALLLRRPNVARLSLGPRILRADTAAVAALALVQGVLGDWGASSFKE
jgi:16S rRNA (uracil1498-N3)-methyltransferase